MKIIRNPILPPRGFAAINLFGFIFARKNTVITARTLRHEAIHTAQMKERFYIGFYLIYLLEWLVLLLRYRNNDKACRAISFEREAYQNDNDKEYLSKRGQ
jgi:hypothetical protein